MTTSVKVRREGDEWIATNSHHRFEFKRRTLTGLQEAITENTNLSVEDFEFDYTDPAMDKANQLRMARVMIDDRAAMLRQGTDRMVPELTDAGLSIRDIGILLGISPGRADQIRHPERPKKGAKPKKPKEG